MTVAAVSLRAQLHSQGKLTTPRHENRKIRHEIQILKENENAPHGYKLQIYGMTTKTYHKISWNYPFKQGNGEILFSKLQLSYRSDIFRVQTRRVTLTIVFRYR
jgi:hypothetical protein